MRNRIDMRVLFIALWAGISLLKVAMCDMSMSLSGFRLRR